MKLYFTPKHTLLFIVFGCCIPIVQAQSNFGEIRGTVTITNGDKSIPVSDANILLYKEGSTQVFKTAESNKSGIYGIQTLDPGQYVIIISHASYGSDTTTVAVRSGDITFNDAVLSGARMLTGWNVKVPKPVKPSIIVNIKIPSNRVAISGDFMKQIGSRSSLELAPLMAGINNSASGGISFRASRPDGTAIFIDGMRMLNSSLTQAGIDQTEYIMSGINGQYGNFTGGVVSITTKNTIGNRKQGSFDFLTSSPFNNYHYNQIEGFYLAPLIKKRIKGAEGDKPRERTVAGFFIAGNINYQKDPAPSAVGYYVVKEDKLREIEQNPLVVNEDGGYVHAANYLTQDKDFDHVKARPNARAYSSSAQLKFDFAPTKNTDITFFNNLNYSNSLAPGGNNLMAYSKNPLRTSTSWASYLRFTQRLVNPENRVEGRNIFLNSAYYSVRLDYQSSWATTQDQQFRDKIFDYGYLGQFKHYSSDYFTYYGDLNNPDGNSRMFVRKPGDTVYLRNFWEQTGFRDTLITFEAGEQNPLRANYTTSLFNSVQEQGGKVTSDVQILQQQGLLNGYNPTNIYSLWNTPGTQLSGYSKSQTERYTLYAVGEAQLSRAVKEGQKAAPHDLQFGFTYEQTISRGYTVRANDLWRQMNLLMNSHISELDKSNPILSYDADGVFQDTVRYNRLIQADKQTTFDKNFRQKLINEGATDIYGKPISETTFVDINSYKPSDFSLDMFSPDELLNNGSSYVTYFGYDQLGRRQKGRPALEDFINNPNKRSIGAFAPIYTAAWIQDQFAFKDLQFRFSLRFERYDANQLVLKDPYSLYPVKSAAEVDGNMNKENNGRHPDNIGEDYTVYVNDVKNPTEILGYRNPSDNKWYSANGSELTNPELLANDSRNASGKIAPYLVNPNNQQITAASFKDYAPKVNVLPRVFFQFPINENALFYASYDVLAQNPISTYSFLTIDDYFYMTQRANNTIANPALRSRLKTDYQIGFKQQLGKTSSLSLNAFYSEIKNDINQFQYNQAYPVTYISYNNIDFSTIKGFGIEHVYSKKSLTVSANYTLMFADGTGSNPNAARALIASNQPNLKTLFPLGDLDIRHTAKAIINYEFRGIDPKTRQNLYKGPVIGKTEILRNTNFNFSFVGSSGLPYTATSQPVNVASVDRAPIIGTPFGSRMPRQFTLNMNISKNIILNWNDKQTGKNKGAFVQVYFYVTNLLNTRNTNNVYAYTGLPNDDGYLNSPKGQQFVASQLSAQSYTDYYRMLINSPGNYSAPRYARLGVKLMF